MPGGLATPPPARCQSSVRGVMHDSWASCPAGETCTFSIMAPTRAKTPPTGMPALVGLLIVVFCIAGLLVYEAWNTGRSRREIAERGLQDYAAYATWSTARIADATLSASLATLFRGLVGTRIASSAPLPPLSALEADAAYVDECDCTLKFPADYYFRVDLRNREFKSAGTVASAPPPSGYATAKVGSYAPPPPPVLPSGTEGEDVMRAVAGANVPRTSDFAVVFANVGGSARVIGMAPQRGEGGGTVGAFGFVAHPETYARTLIGYLWRRPQILPLAITRGLPSDSLLTASVSTPDNKLIYRSNGWSPGLPSDTASLAPAGGGMRVTVALRRDALARLGGGLIPASRVPIWVGLLLLTGLLTAIILRNLQREHELTRLRADFTASVSHELRTPLAQIMLFGETLTLGRTRSEIERTRAAEIIVREARRLMQLVENTLQFSRAGRPVVGLSPERLQLAPAVRDAIAGFQPLAASRGARIIEELDEDAAVIVDRSAFRQIVINLLDNALKYGPRNQTITVGVSSPQATVVPSPAMLAPKPSTLTYVVRVWVEDQGAGVFSAGDEDIWAPFVRGNGDDVEATGCGLGLAVVRELAERHHGKAWVEAARQGRGSRFVVELPAVATEARAGWDAELSRVEGSTDTPSAVA